MENIHRLTKKFMETAGQTVRHTPSVPTVEEMKLRLTLEFEELKEKAQAMGLEGSFAHIVDKFTTECIVAIHNKHFDIAPTQSRQKNFELLDTNEVNLVEVLDAALDQRVVASGTDLCFGFQHLIEAGDIEVYNSNMSKFDLNNDDATATVEKYRKDGIEVWGEIVGDYIVIKRKGDNKVLKSINYKPVDLRPLVELEVELNIEEDGKQS